MKEARATVFYNALKLRLFPKIVEHSPCRPENLFPGLVLVLLYEER